MDEKGLFAGLAVLGGLIILLFLVVFVILGVMIACNWILFKRAGQPGWAALIPIYNLFTMSKIAFGNYNWAFAWLIVWVIQFALSMLGALVGNIDAIAFIGTLFSLASTAVGLLTTLVNGVILFFYSKSFGKEMVWNILMLFFSPIMLIIMALDKNTQYVGPDSFGEEWFDKAKSMIKK